MNDNNITKDAFDDQLIASFFEQYGRQDIADDGFSERVSKLLPRRERSFAEKINTLWTCICGIAAVALFFFVDGIQLISAAVLDVFNHLLASLSTVDVTLTAVITVVTAVSVLLVVAIYNVFLFDYVDYRARANR